MANFIFLVLMMAMPAIHDRLQGKIFLLPFAIFLVIGLILCVSSFKEKKKDRLRKFLMITGGSAVGIFLSMILHNLVYALFIILFGDDFWRRSGLGDEPVFFMLAIIVLPVVFVVGAVGSGVLMIKQHRKAP
jgi:hypothetical protein